MCYTTPHKTRETQEAAWGCEEAKGSQGISLLPTPSPLFLGFSSSILCVFENFAVFKVASLGLGLVLSLFLSVRKVQGSFYVFKLQILNFLMIKISLVT